MKNVLSDDLMIEVFALTNIDLNLGGGGRWAVGA